MSDHTGLARFRRAGRARTIIVLLLLLLAIVGIGGVVAWRQGWVSLSNVPRLSADRLEQILEQRNVAIGMMENHERHKKAIEILQQIAATLPDELLPLQNEVVCRIDYITSRDTEAEKQPLYEPARLALEKLLEKAPDSVAANYLTAYYLTKLPAEGQETDQLERVRQIISFCETAAQADPTEPGLPFMIFWQATNSTDPTRFAEVMESSLRKAYKLAPQNLRLLGEMLMLQVEKQDESIKQTLEQARDIIGPYLLSMQVGDNLNRADGARGIPYDAMLKVDGALQSLEQGNWDEVQKDVYALSASLKTLMNYRDESNRLELNPMEFVLHEFSEEFQLRNSVPPHTASASASFTFKSDNRATQISPDLPVISMRLLDVDLDRRMEWVVLCAGELRVYRWDKNEAPKLTVSAAVSSDARGLLVGDLDNDLTEYTKVTGHARKEDPNDEREWHESDLDFVIYGDSGVQVFRNVVKDSTTRVFEIVEQPAELPIDSLRGVVDALLVDIDHDADLDLVMATNNGTQLWSGRGDGTFEDISKWSKLPKANSQPATIAAVDWDHDIDIDFIVSGKSAIGLLRNEQHGHLLWDPDADLTDARGAVDSAIAELDGNASWDLVTTGPAGVKALFTSTAGGKVTVIETLTLTEESRDHVAVGDIDNNGFPDIVASSPTSFEVYLGEGNRVFRNKQVSIASDAKKPIGLLSLNDIDEDGDLDVIGAIGNRAAIFENELEGSNHWINLRLLGNCDNSGCVGHTGIGSVLELKAGNRYQAQIVMSDVTHFGLGSLEKADVLRIIPTNGVPQAIVQPDTNQYLSEKVTLWGSCPYLYTWNGKRFDFVTDLLWAAPLGMQTSRGMLLPSREWEYLLVPGDRLVARDGTYDLQITEELWEAAYFDQVELLAVDHPQEVDVYSNEKVGPAEIAEFKVHSVSAPQSVVAAHDQLGNDVTHLIHHRDHQYTAPWEEFIRRGLTSEHYLELDLGKLENANRITVYLTGWIMPAGTSLNLYYSQNPNLDLPRPPAIWTPDASGQWRETIPYMGFPGGKTKTIAVDVSDAFAALDYRLRIVTTAQIYWDEIFFTVDEVNSPLEITTCEMASADLHYRGFSERSGYHNNNPETYFYDNVVTDPQWPSMRGNFTRYGDVRELLSAADDRLAVLGSGDEITIKFKVPTNPPPAGWKRDFILHNVGWDKDADLNTLWGQTVEPLPYRSIQEYPYQLDSAPTGPEYEDYLRTYQTRRQDPNQFRLWTKSWSD